MIVYLVEASEAYEYSYVIGIYSTKAGAYAALRAKRSQHDRCDITITRMELNGTLDEVIARSNGLPHWPGPPGSGRRWFGRGRCPKELR